MAVLNRAIWTRLESRARDPGDDASVNAQYRTGAQFRVPPARVTGVSAEGSLGSVIFTWEPVYKTAAGKPLEALARYLVFYRKGISSPIPPINPNDPTTYTGIIYADNTQVVIPCGRALSGGNWYNEIVAVRVAAMDRQGRVGKASDQVEAVPVASRLAAAVDVGYIDAWEINDPNSKKWTDVWNYPSYVVPDGVALVVTVWPLFDVDIVPGDMFADIFGKVEQYYNGLFFANQLPSQGSPILYPGTYTNLKLRIYHYTVGQGWVTCYGSNPDDIVLPLYRFDYDNPGNMRIGGYLTEAVNAEPLSVESIIFQTVLWMVWRLAL